MANAVYILTYLACRHILITWHLLITSSNFFFRVAPQAIDFILVLLSLNDGLRNFNKVSSESLGLLDGIISQLEHVLLLGKNLLGEFETNWCLILCDDILSKLFEVV